jgi:RimJ/RimL family protein N-acetyltransferase/SAM-dependent methyltransferase
VPTLRASAPSDLDWIVELSSDPDVEPFVLPWTRARHEQALADPGRSHLVVERDGVPVGFAILAGLDGEHRSIEVVRVVVAERGRGLGRSALRELLRHAFDDLGAERVWLDVMPQNARARAAYRAAGFVEEGVLRAAIAGADGERHSLVVMSVLAAEWRRGAEARADAGYAEDLAWVHDAGFTALAEAAARRAIAELRGRTGLVVDLGCGSGAGARILSDAGLDVLGIDASAAMVELARRNSPAASFRVGSFADEPLPSCVAVTAVGEVLGYLFDESADLASVFARVHEALEPGGLFLFDLAGPSRQAVSHHASGDGWTVVVDASSDGRTLTRDITTFRRLDAGGAPAASAGAHDTAALWRRSRELHRLRLHRAADVLALLRRTGFRARAIRGYDGTPEWRGLHVFLARRRAA